MLVSTYVPPVRRWEAEEAWLTATLDNLADTYGAGPYSGGQLNQFRNLYARLIALQHAQAGDIQPNGKPYGPGTVQVDEAELPEGLAAAFHAAQGWAQAVDAAAGQPDALGDGSGPGGPGSVPGWVLPAVAGVALWWWLA